MVRFRGLPVKKKVKIIVIVIWLAGREKGVPASFLLRYGRVHVQAFSRGF